MSCGRDLLLSSTSSRRRGEEKIMSNRSLAAAMLSISLLIAGDAAAASAEKGKVAFVKEGCSGCHGTAGQGGFAGPKVGPDPMALDAMITFVRSANRSMPPYSAKILSDADLADIHAYLMSVPKP